MKGEDACVRRIHRPIREGNDTELTMSRKGPPGGGEGQGTGRRGSVLPEEGSKGLLARSGG